MSSGSVKDFYAGKVIFVTGATGYIGRLMLAKLMRLGNVGEILLLSRPKKGKSNEERVDSILSGLLFDELEKFDANFKSKLRVINGDMESEDLGISVADREYIKQNVQIIIHGAATVRFDELLSKAIAINVIGTKSMLDLATEVKNLQSFVHISTAYSQCPQNTVKETFYEPPIDYRQALDLCEKFDAAIMDVLTAKLIFPWPNTYTFTKAISEDMIRQYMDRLYIGIIRPTIVLSTLKDPVAGYADSILGLLGIAIGGTMGLIRIVKGIVNAYVDVVPSDIVVNSTLAIAWKTTFRLSNEKPPIFNCCSSNARPFSGKNMMEVYSNNFKYYPVKQMIWVPKLNVTSSEFMFRFYFFWYHIFPAIFIDIFLRFKGSKFRLVPIYAKIFFYTKISCYFGEHTWKFPNENMVKLHSLMTIQDHEDFPCIITYDDVVPYTIRSLEGISKYFFKENDADRVEAHKKYRLLNALHYCCLGFVYIGGLYFCWWFINGFLSVNNKNVNSFWRK